MESTEQLRGSLEEEEEEGRIEEGIEEEEERNNSKVVVQMQVGTENLKNSAGKVVSMQAAAAAAEEEEDEDDDGKYLSRECSEEEMIMTSQGRRMKKKRKRKRRRAGERSFAEWESEGESSNNYVAKKSKYASNGQHQNQTQNQILNQDHDQDQDQDQDQNQTQNQDQDQSEIQQDDLLTSTNSRTDFGFGYDSPTQVKTNSGSPCTESINTASSSRSGKFAPNLASLPQSILVTDICNAGYLSTRDILSLTQVSKSLRDKLRGGLIMPDSVHVNPQTIREFPGVFGSETETGLWRVVRTVYCTRAEDFKFLVTRQSSVKLSGIRSLVLNGDATTALCGKCGYESSASFAESPDSSDDGSSTCSISISNSSGTSHSRTSSSIGSDNSNNSSNNSNNNSNSNTNGSDSSIDDNSKQIVKQFKPLLPHFPGIVHLFLRRATELKEIPEMGHLTKNLRIFRLSYADKLESLLPLRHCTKLRCIEIERARALTSLAGLENCSGTLQEVSISVSCPALSDISALASMRKLKRIYLSQLDNLESLDVLSGLPRLCSLVIQYLPKIHPIDLEYLLVDKQAWKKTLRELVTDCRLTSRTLVELRKRGVAVGHAMSFW